MSDWLMVISLQCGWGSLGTDKWQCLSGWVSAGVVSHGGGVHGSFTKYAILFK